MFLMSHDVNEMAIYRIAQNFGGKKLADLADETSSANIFSANYLDYNFI